MTALLQSMDGMSVHLYEKRPAYTRTRMVTLAPYLIADSVESYRVDDIDGESVDAIFDPAEVEAGLAERRTIPSDLMTLLRAWVLGFCPLNTIERALSDLIDGRRRMRCSARRRSSRWRRRSRCSSRATSSSTAPAAGRCCGIS